MSTSALFCFTTDVSADKSIGEIVMMLVRAKARSLLQDFDGAGNVTAISFKIATTFGEMAFRLPIDVPATQQVLVNQYRAKRIDRRYANDTAHARKVAWRILRHWVEAQLAMIEVGNVKVEQVFLAFAQRPSDGKTVFEGLVEQRFEGLALPAPETK